MRKPGKGSEALVFGSGDGCGRGTLHTQNQGVNGSLCELPRPPKCRLHTESAVYSQLGRLGGIGQNSSGRRAGSQQFRLETQKNIPNKSPKWIFHTSVRYGRYVFRISF